MANFVITCLYMVLVSLLSTIINVVADDLMKKSRLCIEYEIDNYNSPALRCKTLYGMTKGECFMECARQQSRSCPCIAFQLHSRDGVCELLNNPNCMTENETPGVTFVGLSTCRFIPPWQPTTSPNQSLHWRWVTDPPTMEGTISFQSLLGGVRYVTRGLHKGLYLPGHCRSGLFRTWGPSDEVIKCWSNIQFLIFEDPSFYRWEIFRKGDPMPSTAIIGGYWRDGSPLYIVKVTAGPHNAIHPLYYNADTLQVYPIYDDMNSEMGILVENVPV